jgi:hypothetical protein
MANGTFSVVAEAEPRASGEPLPSRFRLGKRGIEVADVLNPGRVPMIATSGCAAVTARFTFCGTT